MALGLFFKWFFIILTGGVAVSSLLVPILNAGILCFKTKQCKPLTDTTIGQFIASQSLMSNDIKFMKEHPEMDYTMLQPYKDRVFRSFFIALFFIAGIWWIIEKMFGFFIPKEFMNIVLHIFFVLIALAIMYFANVLYSVFALGQANFVPFSGFIDFFKNFNVLIETVGVYSGLNATNSTMGLL